MTKIFITGCAKSGTTMLLDMFHAFERTWVINDEVGLEDFANLTPEQVGNFDFVVGKRSTGTIFSASTLTQRDINRQLFLLAKNDIKVLNLVRDGRNVVKSYLASWGYYNPFEWMECIIQANKYEGFISQWMAYEDLLTTPDDIQVEVAKQFGLTIADKWSDYPNFVPASNRAISSRSYNLRPIDKGKIKVDKTTYLQRPNDVDYFNSLLMQLNYEV